MLPARRPLSVTVTAVGVFLLGAWNVWRSVELARQRDLILALEPSLDPLALLVFAIVWALVFVALAVALWRGLPPVRPWLPLALAAYALYQMLLVAFFVRSPLSRQGWQFDLLLYVVAIAWTVWVLYRPAQRAYWKVDREAGGDDARF